MGLIREIKRLRELLKKKKKKTNRQRFRGREGWGRKIRIVRRKEKLLCFQVGTARDGRSSSPKLKVRALKSG